MKQDLEKVWVVSYFENTDREATVTVFSDEEAAKNCYRIFLRTKSHVAIDQTYIYSGFEGEV